MGAPALLERAEAAGDRLAVVATEGSFSFGDLTEAARGVGTVLLAGRSDLGEARVGVMVPPGFRYAAVQWGTWAAGGISVPLAITHPQPELDHVAADADLSVIVASSGYLDRLEPIARERSIRLLDADDLVFGSPRAGRLPVVEVDRRCLILYTSGTTGPPKGVVWRHANLESQLRILSRAWGWSGADRALLVLPLHHVHGLVNVLTCSLWNGATCEMLPSFDTEDTWNRLSSGRVTVFMAVPTVYRHLISAWEAADQTSRQRLREGLTSMRLMVSGSAALPVPVLEAWRAISDHTLLERYGMTEIGMALSNPYEGRRRPGSVGVPLPSVEVRLVDSSGSPMPDGAPGEIEVRGPSVFSEYWRRPEATAEAFRNGWFRTGDVGVFEEGGYRILGRQSVDIIKTGGEKVSALEVEEVLREHPAVSDCAVVGIVDDVWGERVAAAVVPAGVGFDPADLDAFARRRLAPSKVPRRVVVVEDLPRNALGKVVKPRVRELFGEE